MSAIDLNARSGPRRLVVRHPVLVFLLVAVPAAFAVMSLVVLAVYDRVPGKNLPAKVGLDAEEAASVLLVVTIFGSALGVTRLVDGPDGVRLLLRRMTRWQVPVRWWLVAILAMPCSTVVLALVLGDRLTVPRPSVVVGEVVSLIIAFLVANLGEEGTWYGFVQTRLEGRVGFFSAAALTAIPFALVHVPLRVINKEVDTAGDLLAAFLTILVLALFFRTMLGVVGRGAANSVLLVAVTHTFFNRSNNLGGLTDDLLAGAHRPVAALLGLLVLTVTLAVVNRRRLGRAYRHDLDSAEPAVLRHRRTA